MNIKVNGLISRIFGIVAILVVLALISPIYDANTAISAAITSASNTSSFLVLPTLVPFGVILIVLGLLFTGGLLALKPQSGGIGLIITSVIEVIAVIIILSFFPTIIGQMDGILTTAISASDTIGELFFGTVIPLLIYLIVAVAPAATGGVAYIRSRGKGKRAMAKAGSF